MEYIPAGSKISYKIFKEVDMKDLFVTDLKNVKKFYQVIEKVNHNYAYIEKMALVFSEPGLGKSRTALYYAANNGAVMIRTKKLMSARWLLAEIVDELGGTPAWKSRDLIDQALNLLSAKPRMIILDEIDYFVHDPDVIETMRDLADISHSAMIFIGMSKADKRLMRFPHLYSRFGNNIIKFEKLDLGDVTHMCDQLSDFRFEPDAIERIATETQGNTREIINMIHQAEITAKASKIKVIGRKDFN
jgi:DNA transposition AAA+ family ATPase